jgi:phosphoglycolate phosphatase-like HAD superfamily hydrolase
MRVYPAGSTKFHRKVGPLLRPKYVLLDMDGVLIDSKASFLKSWSEACRHTGKDPTTSALAMGLVGAPLDEIQKVVFGSASVSFGDAFRACQRQNPNLDTVIPGALRLLSALSQASISFGLATSRPAWRCEKGLELLKLGYVRDVFSADTELSKPSGEIVRKIAYERGLQTEDIWMLGDSQIDQQTAIAGGCIFVFAEWGMSQSPIPADYSFRNFEAICEALGLKN